MPPGPGAKPQLLEGAHPAMVALWKWHAAEENEHKNVAFDVYKAAGGSAVYRKGPLDRCLRDILTMNQHVVATSRTFEMAGRLLLGLEPIRWLF